MRTKFFAVADGAAGTGDAAASGDAAAVAAAKVVSDAAAAKVVSDAAAAKVVSDAKAVSDAAAAKVVSDAAAAAAATGGTPDLKAGAPDGTVLPKAPAKYELAIPDGGHVDQTDVDALAVIARTKDWTNEEAQAVLTAHAADLAAQTTRFLTDAKAHTEIGGANFEQAQTHARAALDKFLPAGTPDGDALRSGLNKTGYGNWPPLVVFLAHIGKAMAEDTPVARDAVRAAAAPRTVAEVLYAPTPAAT